MRSVGTMDQFGKKTFTVEWDDWDLVRLDLGPTDMALLRACDESNSIADKLLGLECLARRLEQRGKADTPNA